MNEFQPSPGAMAECDQGKVLYLALEDNVSTLTRRDGRVRLLERAARNTNLALFQPSPGAMAECDLFFSSSVSSSL